MPHILRFALTGRKCGTASATQDHITTQTCPGVLRVDASEHTCWREPRRFHSAAPPPADMRPSAQGNQLGHAWRPRRGEGADPPTSLITALRFSSAFLSLSLLSSRARLTIVLLLIAHGTPIGAPVDKVSAPKRSRPVYRISLVLTFFFHCASGVTNQKANSKKQKKRWRACGFGFRRANIFRRHQADLGPPPRGTGRPTAARPPALLLCHSTLAAVVRGGAASTIRSCCPGVERALLRHCRLMLSTADDKICTPC